MSKLLEQLNKAPRDTKKFGEVFEIIDGDRGANYPSKSEFTKSGYCVFLNTKNVPSQGFDFSNVDFISKERDDLLRKGKLERNDIVMTTRGTIGNVAHYTEDISFDCMRINSGMVILRSKPQVDRSYLYTLIKSSIFNTRLKNTSSGSAQPQLPIKDLKDIELDLPDLSTQQKIASILSAYDAKIENNNKIIKNLEAIARTIFNEWFVNFKFPGYEKVKMVDSEMGEIPEGWQIKNINELFTVILGGTPSREKPEYWGGDVPWINSGEVNKLRILEATEHITELGLNKSNARLIKSGATVLAITGATLGQVSRLEIDSTANQSVVGIFDERDILNEYLYLFIKSNILDLISGASGGAQQHINKQMVENYNILVPLEKVIENFNKNIKLNFLLIRKLFKENISLKSQRDQLLAKLI